MLKNLFLFIYYIYIQYGLSICTHQHVGNCFKVVRHRYRSSPFPIPMLRFSIFYLLYFFLNRRKILLLCFYYIHNLLLVFFPAQNSAIYFIKHFTLLTIFFINFNLYIFIAYLLF